MVRLHFHPSAVAVKYRLPNLAEKHVQSIHELLQAVTDKPDAIEFNDVMTVIDGHYHFEPVSFRCGEARSTAGQNLGSCKILAFAKLHELTEPATLSLFGRFYREDVLQHPDGDDHANIRNFMVHGWQGVEFDADPLTGK